MGFTKELIEGYEKIFKEIGWETVYDYAVCIMETASRSIILFVVLYTFGEVMKENNTYAHPRLALLFLIMLIWCSLPMINFVVKEYKKRKVSNKKVDDGKQTD